MTENIPNLGIFRRGKFYAEALDEMGEVRVIHRTTGGKLAVKREGNTAVHALNRASSILIAANIKKARLASGMRLEELGTKAGLVGNPMKVRMWEIENCTRDQGVRMGTLYALAIALGIHPSELLPCPAEVAALSGVKFITKEGLGA